MIKVTSSREVITAMAEELVITAIAEELKKDATEEQKQIVEEYKRQLLEFF